MVWNCVIWYSKIGIFRKFASNIFLAIKINRPKKPSSRQESVIDKQLREEEKLLKEVQENTALMSAAELAKGIQYIDPIKTSWRPPRRVLAKGIDHHNAVRKRENILVEGDDPPPALTSFKDMKFHRGIIKALTSKSITKPSPIQMQVLILF